MTYADYLATMTVKTLNTIARDMKLKGYSKLRKAELIAFIDKAIEADWDVAHVHAPAVILSTENPADHDTIAALIAEVAVETPTTPSVSAPEARFSAAPTATMARPVNVPQDASEAVSLEDLKDAYRHMRRTVQGMGGRGAEGKRRVRYVGMLRNLSAQLKAQGIKYPQYL